MNTTEMKMVAYEAPTVEVIEVEVEKGFASSPFGGEGSDSDDSELG